MKPAEKASVIASLQSSLKHYSSFLVGMCGDGANDCSSLKTADIGVSLSEAEASIAAPFTSKVQDISCIVKLLREGRCALSNSFQCFKYIVVYSMIQFITVTLLYTSFSAVGDYQFLWIDLFMIFPLAIFMSYTKANKQLSTYLPTTNLISFPVLASIIGQIMIQLIFQVNH
jgi:cation-transporting ATPase 13A2